eukprot:jgi/Chlat1/6216/Chrsp44S05817
MAAASVVAGVPLAMVAGIRRAPHAQQAAQGSKRRHGGSWKPASAMRVLSPGLRLKTRSASKHLRRQSASVLSVFAQNAEDLSRQLQGLRQEREDTLNKVQALDRRCERLTTAMMELYNAAARLMGEEQETAARTRLEERAALSTALERARSRRELYYKLAEKVAQAISAKETLLISTLAAKEPTKAFQQPPPAPRLPEDDRATAASAAASASMSEVGGWISDEDLSNRFLEMERNTLERMMNNVLERASTSDTHPEVPTTNERTQLSEAVTAINEDIMLASRKVGSLKDQLATMKAGTADPESIASLEDRLAKAKAVFADLEALKARLQLEQLGDKSQEVVPEQSSTVKDAGNLERAVLAVKAGDKPTAILMVQKFLSQSAETSSTPERADANALYTVVVEAILGLHNAQGMQITRDGLKGLQTACGLDKPVADAIEATVYRRAVLAHNIGNGRGAFPNLDAARAVLGLSREHIESAEAQASELIGFHRAVLGLVGLQETDDKKWQRVLSEVQSSDLEKSDVQWAMSQAAQTVCYELAQQLLREKGTAQVRGKKLRELLSVPSSLAVGLQVLGHDTLDEDVVTQCSLLGRLSAVQASALYESFLEVNFLLQQEPDSKHVSTLLAVLALPQGLLRASQMAVQTFAARHVMRDCRMEPDGWARLDKFGRWLGLSAFEAASAVQVASGEQASALSKKLLAGRLRGSTISDEELRFLANVCNDLRVVDMPLPDQLKTMLFKRTLDVALKLSRGCDSAEELHAAITASSDLLATMNTALELPQSEYQLSAAADAAAESALLQVKASLQRGDQQLATVDVCRLALALAVHPKPGAAPRVPSRDDAKLMLSLVAPERFGDAPCMQAVRPKLCRYLYLSPDQLPGL